MVPKGRNGCPVFTSNQRKEASKSLQRAPWYVSCQSEEAIRLTSCPHLQSLQGKRQARLAALCEGQSVRMALRPSPRRLPGG